MKSTLAAFLATLLLFAGILGCSDMTTHQVYDEEELDLMTDIDRTGERGYHRVVIFLGDQAQADRHQESISQLRALQPDHIISINILNSIAAEEKYGSRAEQGVIEVTTNQSLASYNTVLRAMGLEPVSGDEMAQNGDLSDEEDDFFTVVEEMPELIGGLAVLMDELSYPERARRAGIEGRVFVQFIVNEQGRVERPRVIRGIGAGCDEEALRVVSQAQFNPGLQNGQPVRVQYSLPIVYQLQKDQDSAPESS
ncbi:MAG: energy transducer TonB [Balneolaceae bacterium]